MAYNPSFPADDGFLADFPPAQREQIRAVIEDMIVNALQLQGLDPGNAAGNVPINNGTKNVNLNADLLDGKDSTEFAAASHVHSVATGSSNGFMSNTDKTKLDTIAANAEVNQNTFSNVLVGETTIQADSKTDTLEIVAGTNIAVTPDATNDRVTIAVTGTVASATTAGTCTGNAATATNATNHIAAASGAHAASAISSTATGNISATNVQAAIAELEAEKQPLDATLTALAAVTTAANKLIYATGSDAFLTTDLTAFARTLLAAANAAAALTTLGAAPLASPALTGTPTAPTAALGTNTTQIATMAALQAAVSAVAEGFPNYASGTTITYDTVYQASVNGWLNVVFTGSYRNTIAVLVGSTSSPGTMIASSGNDYNAYTWGGTFMLPIAAGTYYKVTAPGTIATDGYETITIKFYPAA